MNLTVVVKKPNEDAEVRIIETEDVLKTLQNLVGGYVECMPIGADVRLICNEDGLGLSLKDNCGLVGTIVFVQNQFISDEEGWDWGSLDEENQRKALAWCRKYSGLQHPNKDGGFKLITGDKEIADYRERLATEQQSKLMDWESL